jgi:hypothetical protein
MEKKFWDPRLRFLSNIMTDFFNQFFRLYNTGKSQEIYIDLQERIILMYNAQRRLKDWSYGERMWNDRILLLLKHKSSYPTEIALLIHLLFDVKFNPKLIASAKLIAHLLGKLFWYADDWNDFYMDFKKGYANIFLYHAGLYSNNSPDRSGDLEGHYRTRLVNFATSEMYDCLCQICTLLQQINPNDSLLFDYSLYEINTQVSNSAIDPIKINLQSFKPGNRRKIWDGEILAM